MVKLLQSSWVAAAIGALLFLGTVAVALNPQKLLQARQAELAAVSEAKKPGAGWDFNNPEIDQLISELRKEKEELAAREQQLKELATRLASERAEINQATQAVLVLQREFNEGVVRVREEETANLKKLAKTYAAMTPEGALPIVRQMEDEQVVKIFVYMKEDETAPILEALAKLGNTEAKRAATISEKMRLASFRNKPIQP